MEIATRHFETPHHLAPYDRRTCMSIRDWCKCNAKFLMWFATVKGRIVFQERCPVCWAIGENAPNNLGEARAIEAFGPVRVKYAFDREALVELQPRERLAEIRNQLFSIQYEEHLSSKQWAERRDRTLMLSRGLCERCGSSAQHVHHKHYTTLGNEGDDDLEALCVPCHHAHHGRTF